MKALQLISSLLLVGLTTSCTIIGATVGSSIQHPEKVRRVSPEQIDTVEPGSKVIVVDRSGYRVRGRYQGSRGDDVLVTKKGEPAPTAVSGVYQVEVVEQEERSEVVAGLLVGAAIDVMICVALAQSFKSSFQWHSSDGSYLGGR